MPAAADAAAMPDIHDITPFTLLDYPDELACIVWFAGCNLRCVYCHNPGIVHGKGKFGAEDYEAFLHQRRGKLSGVVLSGGEPTLCARLPSYARTAKEMGFKIKLDTNGTRPRMIEHLLDEKLVDYVALDFKCPPHLGKALLGTAKFMPLFAQSLRLLIERQSDIRLEIRTTFHGDHMHESDLAQMAETLDAQGYKGVYYVQNIVSTGDKTLGNIAPPSRLPAAAPYAENFTVDFRNFPAQEVSMRNGDL
ncbi:MAG: anaerobic ribonucleoside-triphosphate reductase activating protein [Alphaproteobacteria bacterium]|nr:anaerobic ribonucleoside-triphosphate reductase activating protein [Alphaproteobacteria bacterium]